eukprot:3192212-Prymnesium_polylepis.2
MPKHASSPRLHSERSAAARRPHLGPSSASHDRRSNGKPSHDPIVNHGLGRSRARRDAALTEALIGLLEYTRQPRPLDPVRARLAAPAALRVRARRPAPARRPEGILRLLAQLLKRVDQPALRRRGARAPGGLGAAAPVPHAHAERRLSLEPLLPIALQLIVLLRRFEGFGFRARVGCGWRRAGCVRAAPRGAARACLRISTCSVLSLATLDMSETSSFSCAISSCFFSKIIATSDRLERPDMTDIASSDGGAEG